MQVSPKAIVLTTNLRTDAIFSLSIKATLDVGNSSQRENVHKRHLNPYESPQYTPLFHISHNFLPKANTGNLQRLDLIPIYIRVDKDVTCSLAK